MKINYHIPLKDIELSLEGSRVLSICIFNRTPRKFLCLLANHCNRVLLNFCLLNWVISVNLSIFCYISLFCFIYFKSLSSCAYRVKVFSNRLFLLPYEYISIIIFVLE